MNDGASGGAGYGQSQEVTGEVVLSATDLASAAILPGLLHDLCALAPALHLRIVSSNDISNVVQRDADIAVRHVRPKEGDLIAKHVGDFGANLFAATSYLEHAGRPKTLRDLANHTFIGSPDNDQMISSLRDKGIPIRRDNFAISRENGVVLWELLKAGYGMTFMPEHLGETTPGVEKVISDLPSLEFPIWLVTHRELKTSQRIRVVFDLLVRKLAEVART